MFIFLSFFLLLSNLKDKLCLCLCVSRLTFMRLCVISHLALFLGVVLGAVLPFCFFFEVGQASY